MPTNSGSYATGKRSRSIYEASNTAVNEDEARSALDEFEASELGQKYPQSVKVWRDAWDRFIPFLQFPPAARKVIYTTNSIEIDEQRASESNTKPRSVPIGFSGSEDAVVDDL